MFFHFPKRASRPNHHPLSHGDGIPPLLKAVIVVAILPVALLVAVILSLRAELAPDRLAVQPSPTDLCGPFVEQPVDAGGIDAAPSHICLH